MAAAGFYRWRCAGRQGGPGSESGRATRRRPIVLCSGPWSGAPSRSPSCAARWCGRASRKDAVEGGARPGTAMPGCSMTPHSLPGSSSRAPSGAAGRSGSGGTCCAMGVARCGRSSARCRSPLPPITILNSQRSALARKRLTATPRLAPLSPAAPGHGLSRSVAGSAGEPSPTMVRRVVREQEQP